MFYLLAVLVVVLVILLVCYPSWFYNHFIYTVSRSQPFYTDDEKRTIFPQSTLLEDSWESIRDEYLQIKINDHGNIGENILDEFDPEFFKGWSMFPLRVFGYDVTENMKQIPALSSVLRSSPNIVSAYISVLEPGKKLRPHSGPFAGIIRYHLGLSIPYNNETESCYIYVNKKKYLWKDGEGILFDEMYEHHAANLSDLHRVVLFLDIVKPLSYPFNKVNESVIHHIGKTKKVQRAIHKR